MNEPTSNPGAALASAPPPDTGGASASAVAPPARQFDAVIQTPLHDFGILEAIYGVGPVDTMPDDDDLRLALCALTGEEFEDCLNYADFCAWARAVCAERLGDRA